MTPVTPPQSEEAADRLYKCAFQNQPPPRVFGIASIVPAPGLCDDQPSWSQKAVSVTDRFVQKRENSRLQKNLTSSSCCCHAFIGKRRAAQRFSSATYKVWITAFENAIRSVQSFGCAETAHVRRLFARAHFGTWIRGLVASLRSTIRHLSKKQFLNGVLVHRLTHALLSTPDVRLGTVRHNHRRTAIDCPSVYCRIKSCSSTIDGHSSANLEELDA